MSLKLPTETEKNACLEHGYTLTDEFLGGGAHGRVFTAIASPERVAKNRKLLTVTDSDEEFKVAIKIIYLDLGKEFVGKCAKYLPNEANVMNYFFGRPYLTWLYETFISNKRVFFVLERGSCTLRSVKYDEENARSVFAQMVRGLNTLHKNGFAHRDLKLDNVLVMPSGEVKLADFGFTKYATEHELWRHCPKTYCGTTSTMAPEFFSRDEGYDIGSYRVDLWSIGVILYTMVSGGKYPFREKTIADYRILFQQNPKPTYSMPEGISQDCADLLSKLLCYDPEKRITTENILKHPWIASQEVHGRCLWQEKGNAVMRRHVFDADSTMQEDYMSSYLYQRKRLLVDRFTSIKSKVPDQFVPEFGMVINVAERNGASKKQEFWRFSKQKIDTKLSDDPNAPEKGSNYLQPDYGIGFDCEFANHDSSCILMPKIRRVVLTTPLLKYWSLVAEGKTKLKSIEDKWVLHCNTVDLGENVKKQLSASEISVSRNESPINVVQSKDVHSSICLISLASMDSTKVGKRTDKIISLKNKEKVVDSQKPDNVIKCNDIFSDLQPIKSSTKPKDGSTKPIKCNDIFSDLQPIKSSTKPKDGSTKPIKCNDIFADLQPIQSSTKPKDGSTKPIKCNDIFSDLQPIKSSTKPKDGSTKPIKCNDIFADLQPIESSTKPKDGSVKPIKCNDIFADLQPIKSSTKPKDGSTKPIKCKDIFANLQPIKSSTKPESAPAKEIKCNDIFANLQPIESSTKPESAPAKEIKCNDVSADLPAIVTKYHDDISASGRNSDVFAAGPSKPIECFDIFADLQPINAPAEPTGKKEGGKKTLKFLKKSLLPKGGNGLSSLYHSFGRTTSRPIPSAKRSKEPKDLPSLSTTDGVEAMRRLAQARLTYSAAKLASGKEGVSSFNADDISKPAIKTPIIKTSKKQVDKLPTAISFAQRMKNAVSRLTGSKAAGIVDYHPKPPVKLQPLDLNNNPKVANAGVASGDKKCNEKLTQEPHLRLTLSRPYKHVNVKTRQVKLAAAASGDSRPQKSPRPSVHAEKVKHSDKEPHLNLAGARPYKSIDAKSKGEKVPDVKSLKSYIQKHNDSVLPEPKLNVSSTNPVKPLAPKPKSKLACARQIKSLESPSKAVKPVSPPIKAIVAKQAVLDVTSAKMNPSRRPLTAKPSSTRSNIKTVAHIKPDVPRPKSLRQLRKSVRPVTKNLNVDRSEKSSREDNIFIKLTPIQAFTKPVLKSCFTGDAKHEDGSDGHISEEISVANSVAKVADVKKLKLGCQSSHSSIRPTYSISEHLTGNDKSACDNSVSLLKVQSKPCGTFDDSTDHSVSENLTGDSNSAGSSVLLLKIESKPPVPQGNVDDSISEQLTAVANGSLSASVHFLNIDSKPSFPKGNVDDSISEQLTVIPDGSLSASVYFLSLDIKPPVPQGNVDDSISEQLSVASISTESASVSMLKISKNEQPVSQGTIDDSISGHLISLTGISKDGSILEELANSATNTEGSDSKQLADFNTGPKVILLGQSFTSDPKILSIVTNTCNRVIDPTPAQTPTEELYSSDFDSFSSETTPKVSADLNLLNSAEDQSTDKYEYASDFESSTEYPPPLSPDPSAIQSHSHGDDTKSSNTCLEAVLKKYIPRAPKSKATCKQSEELLKKSEEHLKKFIISKTSLLVSNNIQTGKRDEDVEYSDTFTGSATIKSHTEEASKQPDDILKKSDIEAVISETTEKEVPEMSLKDFCKPADVVDGVTSAVKCGSYQDQVPLEIKRRLGSFNNIEHNLGKETRIDALALIRKRILDESINVDNGKLPSLIATKNSASLCFQMFNNDQSPVLQTTQMIAKERNQINSLPSSYKPGEKSKEVTPTSVAEFIAVKTSVIKGKKKCGKGKINIDEVVQSDAIGRMIKTLKSKGTSSKPNNNGSTVFCPSIPRAKPITPLYYGDKSSIGDTPSGKLSAFKVFRRFENEIYASDDGNPESRIKDASSKPNVTMKIGQAEHVISATTDWKPECSIKDTSSKPKVSAEMCQAEDVISATTDWKPECRIEDTSSKPKVSMEMCQAQDVISATTDWKPECSIEDASSKPKVSAEMCQAEHVISATTDWKPECRIEDTSSKPKVSVEIGQAEHVISATTDWKPECSIEDTSSKLKVSAEIGQAEHVISATTDWKPECSIEDTSSKLKVSMEMCQAQDVISATTDWKPECSIEDTSSKPKVSAEIGQAEDVISATTNWKPECSIEDTSSKPKVSVEIGQAEHVISATTDWKPECSIKDTSSKLKVSVEIDQAEHVISANTDGKPESIIENAFRKPKNVHSTQKFLLESNHDKGLALQTVQEKNEDPKKCDLFDMELLMENSKTRKAHYNDVGGVGVIIKNKPGEGDRLNPLVHANSVQACGVNACGSSVSGIHSTRGALKKEVSAFLTPQPSSGNNNNEPTTSTEIKTDNQSKDRPSLLTFIGGVFQRIKVALPNKCSAHSESPTTSSELDMDTIEQETKCVKHFYLTPKRPSTAKPNRRRPVIARAFKLKKRMEIFEEQTPVEKFNDSPKRPSTDKVSGS